MSGQGCSSTRGILWGDAANSSYKSIDYITIATTGNALDFGDSVTATGYQNACSSTTRCLAGGGQSPATTDAIDMVEISSTGDATDFGDLITSSHFSCASYSNGHGGLG